eukprot:Gb_30702 [translate_table: standard]
MWLFSYEGRPRDRVTSLKEVVVFLCDGRPRDQLCDNMMTVEFVSSQLAFEDFYDGMPYAFCSMIEKEKTEAIAESFPTKTSDGGSVNRDAVLAKFNTEKRVALIKAWEDSEKAKAENKYLKEVPNIGAQEKTKMSAGEARLRKAEEKLERKKAACVEKMKNEIAAIHKRAEEKLAMAEAKRSEEMLKAEEFAAKYRASGQIPKKFLLCFGG